MTVLAAAAFLAGWTLIAAGLAITIGARIYTHRRRTWQRINTDLADLGITPCLMCQLGDTTPHSNTRP